MHAGASPSNRSRRASPRLIACVAVSVFGSTLTGQRLFADLAPWTRPATDLGLLPLAGDHLFFTFEDLDHGREPWVLDLAAPVTRYGWGCAGTGGRPVDLSLRGSPVPGASLDFRLGAARPAASAVVLLGGGTAGLGLTPACAAWVTPPWILVGTTTTATGRASLRLPPLDVGMVGHLVAAQAAVFDPQGAHAGLLAWSNAVALLVGR